MHITNILNLVYVPSDSIVAREIEGEIIIVPLTADIGGSAGELFTLNETGKAIWKRLDGQHTLQDTVKDLTQEYHGNEQEIQQDVIGLVKELVNRNMLVKINDLQ